METDKPNAADAATTGARLSQPQPSRRRRGAGFSIGTGFGIRARCGWDSRAPNSLLNLRELSSLYYGWNFFGRARRSARTAYEMSWDCARGARRLTGKIRVHSCPSVFKLLKPA